MAPADKSVPKGTSLSLHVRSIAAGVAGNFDLLALCVDAEKTVELCKEQRKTCLSNAEVTFVSLWMKTSAFSSSQLFSVAPYCLQQAQHD